MLRGPHAALQPASGMHARARSDQSVSCCACARKHTVTMYGSVTQHTAAFQAHYLRFSLVTLGRRHLSHCDSSATLDPCFHRNLKPSAHSMPAERQ